MIATEATRPLFEVKERPGVFLGRKCTILVDRPGVLVFRLNSPDDDGLALQYKKMLIAVGLIPTDDPEGMSQDRDGKTAEIPSNDHV